MPGHPRLRRFEVAKLFDLCHHRIMTSISDDRKSCAPPRWGVVHVGVRIPPDPLGELARWAEGQPRPGLGRPEAIGRLIQIGLPAAKADGPKPEFPNQVRDMPAPGRKRA